MQLHAGQPSQRLAALGHRHAERFQLALARRQSGRLMKISQYASSGLQELKEEVLPQSLTHLIFDHYSNFNQKLKEGVLPQKLTHLTFGWDFNQEFNE